MGEVEITSCGNIFKFWRNFRLSSNSAAREFGKTAKIQNEAWITGIQEDADVNGALMLAHSLRRYRTKRTIAAVFVQGVSGQERRKLRHSFDTVFVLDDTFLDNVQIPLEMKVKIFAISLPVFKKCVFVSANHTVNENLDNVFEEAFKVGFSDKMTSYVQLDASLIMSTPELQSQEEIERMFEEEWETSTPLNNMVLPVRTYYVPETLKEQFSLQMRESNEQSTIMKARKWALLGGQDYSKIREQCLRDRTLFEDPDFPAEDSSLFLSPYIQGEIEMKRPIELSKVPQFVVASASRFDIIQGQLGDCWYLASVASLTLNKEMFSTVVPEDNTFEIGKYCGAFHFRFWKNGEWVDIVIDDRLPTQYGRPIYMTSREGNEFWGALLEKAYAKLHGSYHNLDGGMSNEAFTHFVGGINEFYLTDESPPNMFEILERAEKHQSFLSCATGSLEGPEGESTGLGEWSKAWSDGSEEWNSISEKLRNELGLTIDNDGEFWMSFEDVLKYFRTLEICHWNPDDFGTGWDGMEEDGQQKWHCHMYEDKWIRGATAGGYPQGMEEKDREDYPLESFASNPQYIVTLVDPDEDDDMKKCTLLVALLQKTPRNKGSDGYLSIGFRVYSLPKPETQKKPLPAQFFLSHEPVSEKPDFHGLLQVCQRFSLDPGTYVIVPCTVMPNTEGEFLLRVFTESNVEMKENEGEISLLDVETRLVRDDKEERGHIEELFKENVGERKEIDWIGLKTILDSAMKDAYQFEDAFPKDVCRSLVGLRDASKRGKLQFDDVLHLCKCVSTWTMAFKMYDHDSSGHLNGFELRNVFASMGFGVDKKMLQIIGVRHGDENGHITFDEFIKCAVKLKTIWDLMFHLNSNKEVEGGTPSADVNEDEWFYSILYL